MSPGRDPNNFKQIHSHFFISEEIHPGPLEASLPVDASVFFSFPFFPFSFFCPPECFNSLCNFLLLPTLKSERRRLGKKREKNDLQHMIAEHYTEVSLHNTQNISAYQLLETSQDLYLAASLAIPLTLPPRVAPSQRRDGLGGGCLREQLIASQEVIMDARCARRSCSDQRCASAGASPVLTLRSFSLPLLPLRCHPRSISLLLQFFFPLPCYFSLPPPHPPCLLHLPNPPPPPPPPLPPPLSPFTPSPHHFCLLSLFPLAPLASLPPALLFSTFEASLVSASSDKLWI